MLHLIEFWEYLAHINIEFWLYAILELYIVVPSRHCSYPTGSTSFVLLSFTTWNFMLTLAVSIRLFPFVQLLLYKVAFFSICAWFGADSGHLELGHLLFILLYFYLFHFLHEFCSSLSVLLLFPQLLLLCLSRNLVLFRWYCCRHLMIADTKRVFFCFS